MEARFFLGLEGDRRPGRRPRARVGRGVDVALAAHRGAEFRRRAGDAAHLGARVVGVGAARVGLFGAVEVGDHPGPGAAGRVGRAGEGAVAADDHAEGGGGAGGAVESRRFFGQLGQVPLQGRGRLGKERQRAGCEHGDERAAGRTGHGSHGDRPSFDRRRRSPRSRKTPSARELRSGQASQDSATASALWRLRLWPVTASMKSSRSSASRRIGRWRGRSRCAGRRAAARSRRSRRRRRACA